MMLRISHTTEYTFSSEVFLEPQILRFKPKSTAFCRLQKFNIKVDPKPKGLSQFFDSENNDIQLCWFNNLHKKLSIKSESLLQIQDYNPFNFLIYPQEYTTVPFQYNATETDTLSIYLQVQDVSDELIRFGNIILAESNHKTVNFLINLTNAIHDMFHIESRFEGAPHSPATSFNIKSGSCRDLAWMQINLLRCHGLASRFVSGYYFLDDESSEFELHAWLEVYLPGAGWIGIDPTHGIITGNHHIPVSSSYKHENTMPVTGTIRGNSRSKMMTDLVIEKI